LSAVPEVWEAEEEPDHWEAPNAPTEIDSDDDDDRDAGSRSHDEDLGASPEPHGSEEGDGPDGSEAPLSPGTTARIREIATARAALSGQEISPSMRVWETMTEAEREVHRRQREVRREVCERQAARVSPGAPYGLNLAGAPLERPLRPPRDERSRSPPPVWALPEADMPVQLRLAFADGNGEPSERRIEQGFEEWETHVGQQRAQWDWARRRAREQAEERARVALEASTFQLRREAAQAALHPGETGTRADDSRTPSLEGDAPPHERGEITPIYTNVGKTPHCAQSRGENGYKWTKVFVTFDTGSAVSGIPEEMVPPGTKMSTLTGHYISASQDPVNILGTALIPVRWTNGLEQYVQFEVLKPLKRPIFSVARMAQAGFRVVLEGTRGMCTHLPSGNKYPVTIKGGIYVMEVWFKRPLNRDFPDGGGRQGPQ